MKPRTANAILKNLVSDACPFNWGDDDRTAKLWLEAEKATGVALPDPDYFYNQDARKRLGDPPPPLPREPIVGFDS